MKDRLTPELQEIKKEVDNYYKSNPLTNLPFGTAAWYLLASAEEDILRERFEIVETQPVSDENMEPILTVRPRQLTYQENARISDNFVNAPKYPMCWLHCDCQQGGQVPSAYDDGFYNASSDLFELGHKYRAFVSAFTYARHGWIELELKESTIQPTENIFTGMEYEAYDRLVKSHESQEASTSVNPDNLHLLGKKIAHSLKIHRDRFKYKLNPGMVSYTITTFIKPALDGAFSLPSEWQLSRYTLGDFRKVFEAISAMAYIHKMAREMAAAWGCSDMSYVDSIYIRPFDDLLNQVVRYSRVPKSEVRSIFDDLSYGNRGISNPDPILQPLIKLNSEVYAIVPHLWLCSSPERNLTVLLNRLPSEKKTYAKLVSKKEDLMRERFTTGLSTKGFRSIKGWVPDLPPDIDLAIISDSEKACLLLELKWLIEPAEAIEVIRRSKMIKKGISQLTQLKEAFANNHAPLLEKLNIDSSYRLEGVVASKNCVGHPKVQSPEIPVIQADHLIAKLKATESLESTMEWLKDRKYLPKEGVDFKVQTNPVTIGSWSVKWYGIKSLISDPFFPL